MAGVDLIVRDTIFVYFVPFGLLVGLLIIFLTDSSRDLRKRFSLWLTKDFAKIHEELIEDVKKALFADLHEIESRVVDLRNKGVIRVMEIGVGSGRNLQYYPQQCRLVVVDPNIYFKQYFQENRKLFPDINLEKFVISSGENIRALASNSVDVVVTTIVLCSVSNISKTLTEIKRVLVPGGKYYFLEHTIDTSDRKTRKSQRFFSWTGLWPWLFEGCQFRNIYAEVTKIGFEQVDFKEFKLDPTPTQFRKTRYLMEVMSPHVVGVAQK